MDFKNRTNKNVLNKDITSAEIMSDAAQAVSDVVQVIGAPATDSNIFKDLHNKWDVLSDVYSKHFFKDGDSAIADELLTTFGTEGYDAYKAKREKFFSTTPVVYESDTGVAKELSNARYLVNTINNPVTAAEFNTAVANDTLHMYVLDNDEANRLRNPYDTQWGTRNIGRDKLVGVNEADRFVLYDTSTGKYYRYYNDADEEYVSFKNELAAYESLYEARVASHELGTSVYQKRIESAKNYKEYQKVYEEYTEWYSKSAASINEISTKLSELQKNNYMPNAATINKIHADIDAAEAERAGIEKYAVCMADYNDAYQMNSAADVVRDAIRRRGEDDYFEMLWEDAKDVWKYKSIPFTVDDVKVKDRVKMFVLSTLVDFGETMDMFAAPVKAAILAETYGHNKEEAIKATWGLSELYTHNPNFDYNTGMLATDLLLEVISDPGTWLSVITGNVSGLASDGLTEVAERALKEAGQEMSEEAVQALSKKALNHIATSGKSAEDAIQEVLIRELTSKDVQYTLAKLDGANFVEANKIAQLVINNKTFSNTGISAVEIQRLLKGTKVSEEQLYTIVEMCVTSRRSFEMSVKGVSKELAGTNAVKVAVAMQKLRKLDDVYTNAVKWVTLAPITATWKFAVRPTFKFIYSKTKIPSEIRAYLMEALKKFTSKAADTPLDAEIVTHDFVEEVNQVIRYARTLNEDPTFEAELIEEELRDVANTLTKTIYNNMAERTLREFNDALAYALSNMPNTIMTAADALKLYDEVALKITNKQFTYSQLFNFMTRGSAYAKALSSANRTAFENLELMRELLYSRASYATRAETYKAINQSFDTVNRALDSILSHDINVEFVITSYEQGMRTLKEIVERNDNATVRTELTEVLAPLDDYLTLYRSAARAKDAEYRLFNMPHGDTILSAFRNAGDVFKQHYTDAFTEVALKEIDEQLSKLTHTLKPNHVVTKNGRTVAGVITALLKDAKGVTADELASVIVRELDKAKLDLMHTYAVIDISNIAKHEAVFSNPEINAIVDNILDAEQPLSKVLNNAVVHADLATAQGKLLRKAVGTLYGYRLEAEFLRGLEEAQLPQHIILAVKDTMADNAVNSINYLVNNLDFNSAAAVESAITQICETLQKESQQYMQGITDVTRNVQMYHNNIDGNVVSFNTGDAAANVQAILDHASSDFLASPIAASAKEGVHDIIYSVVKATKTGDPLQIAFADSVTKEVFTYTHKEVTAGAYDITDDVSRKMHGTDAAKFKEQALAAKCTVYNNPQEMWDAIQTQLRTFASAEGQIRYVGFNTGRAYSGQEAVLKKHINKLGLTKGEFVDLADVIRREQFPETYVDDSMLAVIEQQVELHLNAINNIRKTLDGLSIPFGVTVDDLVNNGSYRVAQDLFNLLNKGQSEYFPSNMPLMILDNAEVPATRAQLGKMVTLEELSRRAIGHQSIPDSMEVLVDMDALKEVYLRHTGKHLNIMHELRRLQGTPLNIRYTYQPDELKRWFKSSKLTALSAEDVTKLHEVYKNLLYWEAAIKETHVPEMFSKRMYREVYIEMTRNLQPGYKYSKMYDAIKNGVLDYEKLSKNQRMALLLSMREFADVKVVTDATASHYHGGRGGYYASPLADYVHNYRTYLKDGYDAYAVRDITVYNEYNRIVNIVEQVGGTAESLTNMLSSVDAVEEFISALDSTLGRGSSGYEAATLAEISADVRKMQSEFTRVKNNYYHAAVAFNDSIKNGGFDATVYKELLEAEAAYNKFNRELREASEAVVSRAVLNVVGMSDEALYAHLKTNCAGAMLIQLDSVSFANHQDVLLNWVERLRTMDNITVDSKELFYDGLAHPVLVVKYVGEDSSRDLQKALYKIQHLSFSESPALFENLSKYMPNTFHLSDYTPANVDATKRILQFAGHSEKAANDIVQKLQHYDIFTSGFNCNALGDVAFVRQFYPHRSNSILSTVELGLTHNLSKLAECTYGTVLLRTPMYNMSRYITADVSFKEFTEFVNKFQYVLCKLDESGAPVKVKLTEDIFDTVQTAVKNKTVYTGEYKLVPTEFFENSLDMYNRLKSKEQFYTQSGLAYAKGAFSYAISKTMLLYKQAMLFTHIGTVMNNLIGGTENFVSDAGAQGLLKFPVYAEENGLAARIYERIVNEFPNFQDNKAIIQFYRAHPEVEEMLPQQIFADWYAIKVANGGLSDAGFQKMLDSQPTRLMNEAVRMYDLKLTDIETEEFLDYMKQKCNTFDKVYNKNFDKRVNDYDWVNIQKQLNEHFAHDDSRWAEYAQGVSMQYLATRKDIANIADIPILGKYFGINQKAFSNVEDYLRYAITRHYMDMGHSRQSAITQMLRTQFDYSNQPGIVRALDNIMPFTTYKVCNLRYWITNSNTHASANRMLANLGQYQAIVDPMELAKVIYWTQYFENAEEDAEVENYKVLEQLTAGYGSNELYQTSRGKLKLPGNHYLKNTAPFFEAFELYTQVCLAMTDPEAFNELLNNNLFQPIVTLQNLVNDYKNGNIDEEYYVENYYAINGLLPVIGNLANRIIAKAKAWNVNQITPAEIKTLFAFGQSTAEEVLDAVIGMIAVIEPSVVGTLKDTKPVGYHWNEQSDEYKATHKFIYGVSALPTVFTKNPATYVDHAGMLMELGFTKEEAIDLLTKGWYFDTDGNAHQYKIYEDEDMPDTFKYNPEIFDNTLRYLLERGYDIDAAYTYMKSFGKWVDDDGNVRSLDDVELLWKESVEAKQYYQVPAYIRNIPDQYSRQLNHYKAQGFTTEQARYQMITNPIFVDDDGTVHTLSQEQYYELNTAFKYNVRYETDAQLKETTEQYVEHAKAPNFSGLAEYIREERTHYEGGRSNQASSYPSRYRRPKNTARTIANTNLVKKIYGINNISRNRMRYAMSHSHYRSANRYNAEMVRSLFRNF